MLNLRSAAALLVLAALIAAMLRAVPVAVSAAGWTLFLRVISLNLLRAVVHLYILASALSYFASYLLSTSLAYCASQMRLSWRSVPLESSQAAGPPAAPMFGIPHTPTTHVPPLDLSSKFMSTTSSFTEYRVMCRVIPKAMSKRMSRATIRPSVDEARVRP